MNSSFSLGGCVFLGALLLAGCSGARWGEEAGAGGGRMGNALAMNSGENVGTGGVSGNLADATAEVIATSKARQEERDQAVRTGDALMKYLGNTRIKTPRYLAVWVSDKALRAVLFDTRTHTVGNEVYELRSVPKNGSMIRLGGHRALCITALSSS